MSGDRQHVSYGQRALKGQIFNDGYCSLWTEAPVIKAVFNYVQNFKCGKETAQSVLLQHHLIIVQ